MPRFTHSTWVETREGRRANGYYMPFRMNTRSRTARLPPPDLPGLDPAWATLVTATDADGVDRTWHVLDTGAKPEGGTILCVHGNPNWSYMWRGIARSMPDWRVVAVDALNMGYSERTGAARRLADRITDLDAVTNALDIDGPVITVAHDWGGPISLGWAQRNVEQLAGVVLMNTSVALPDGVNMPPLIAAARSTLRFTCETTPIFLHGAFRMARPQLDRGVYRAYTAPYSSAELRTGIRDFVEDIPIEDTHETFDRLADVATGLAALQHVPALLLWGAKDPVFSDAFLHDLIQRLPHASVHRYPNAGHQIIEDTDAVDVIGTWITQRTLDAEGIDDQEPLTADPGLAIWAAIDARASDDAQAIVEMHTKETRQVDRSISFGELDHQVRAMAQALSAAGVRRGDRLATLVPPGIDLIVLVYACLRSGIVIVPPDAALGINGMRRALRSSRPDYLVSDWRGLTLAKALRLPATRLALDDLTKAAANPSDAVVGEPTAQDAAAVVFTSGSTGPSKGVVYAPGQLQAQRDAVREAFGVAPTDRLVVAFAPFAVLAPALGIPSVVPPMDVTKPATLTARTLADASAAIEATIVFASPAVLANIAATADALDDADRAVFESVRSVVTAGAPVSPQLLTLVAPLFPNAGFFTPYGMTELMPVTSAASDEITSSDDDSGVCVGHPLRSVELAIRPTDAPSGTLPEPVATGELGEVWVRAAHGAQRYDNLWRQTNHAFVDGWHRSGDVGHVDAMGRLWIEGRVDHLIHGPQGVIAPVQVELGAESVAGVARAAAVGVGPIGTQQLAVVVTGPTLGSAVVADAALASAVRSAIDADVAAVLVASKIPVDRRHNSKVDRSAMQRWADAVLRGARPPRL